MTYLIIEPEHKGHYIVLYIKFIVRLLAKKKNNIIILTTKKTTQHKSFKSLYKEHKNIKIEFIKYIKPRNFSSISILIYQIKLFFLIKSAYKKIHNKYEIDHIFFNSLDHFDKALCIFGDPFLNVNFSGIYVNPKFHLKRFNLGIAGRYNYFSEFFFKKLLLISNLKNILTNDRFFIDYANQNKFKNLYKLKFLYEPREFNYKFSKSYSINALHLPKNKFYILVYGALKKTKGVNELFSAMNSKYINNKVSVILAGEQDQYIKTLLTSNISKLLIKNKKLYVFEGFKNEKEETILFSASDTVWVAYQKTFPFLSGVLYQAAIKLLPVIASNHGIIGWMNKKYKLGLSVDINVTSLVVKTINKLCKNKIYNSFSSNIKTFAQKVDPKFFMKQINDLLIEKH
jgi:glycosyltransferase involved in cell wall biosynthesis